MTYRFALLLSAITAAALAGVACGSSSSTETPTATATQAAATASPTAAAAYPKTVRDLLGRSVTIKAAPQHIVTASPSAIELLYAAGGTAVARSSTATFLPGTDKLADIGPSYQPAFEKILEQKPDLVIADASAQGHLAKQFEASLPGVPVIFVGALKYADVGTSIRLIGDVIAKPEQAKQAADGIDAVATRVQTAAKSAKPTRVLVLVAGRDGGMSAALNDSFIGDMVRLAGGDNVGAKLPQSGQVPGYALVSLESVVKDDPDAILVIVPGNLPGPSIGASVAQQFPTLSAAKNNRIGTIDLDVYLQAPGPRAANGLIALFNLLHPEAKLS